METAASTTQFTVPAASYAAVYSRRYAATALTLSALPLLCAILAGFHDIRWWLIALMCLLIVYPMVLTLAWLALMARPSMSTRLRPQVWHFAPEGDIAVDFLRFPTPEADEESDEQQSIAASTAISHGDIARTVPTGRFHAFHLRKGLDFDFILIPSDLIPAEMVNLYDNETVSS